MFLLKACHVVDVTNYAHFYLKKLFYFVLLFKKNVLMYVSRGIPRKNLVLTNSPDVVSNSSNCSNFFVIPANSLVISLIIY